MKNIIKIVVVILGIFIYKNSAAMDDIFNYIPEEYKKLVKEGK